MSGDMLKFGRRPVMVPRVGVIVLTHACAKAGNIGALSQQHEMAAGKTAGADLTRVGFFMRDAC